MLTRENIDIVKIELETLYKDINQVRVEAISSEIIHEILQLRKEISVLDLYLQNDSILSLKDRINSINQRLNSLGIKNNLGISH